MTVDDYMSIYISFIGDQRMYKILKLFLEHVPLNLDIRPDSLNVKSVIKAATII